MEFIRLLSMKDIVFDKALNEGRLNKIAWAYGTSMNLDIQIPTVVSRGLTYLTLAIVRLIVTIIARALLEYTRAYKDGLATNVLLWYHPPPFLSLSTTTAF